MNRGHPEDRSRLSWWFPKLPRYILTPETVIIPYNGHNLISLLDGETPVDFKILCGRIASVGSGLGWPLFLRTDYLSGKHNWKNTCHVPGPEYIEKRVTRIHNIRRMTTSDIEVPFDTKGR